MANEKFYCFYHNDMDGKAAGYCVYKHLTELGYEIYPNCFQKHAYGDPWKTSFIDKDTVVFLVDLSFTETTEHTLINMCEIAKEVIWIDHHQSSMDLYNRDTARLNSIDNLTIFLHNNACGALLTYIWTQTTPYNIWHYMGCGNNRQLMLNDDHTLAITTAYGKQSTYMKVNVPVWLNIIDDYDRWCGRMPELTDKFILGCDTANTALITKNGDSIEFNLEFWDSLKNEDTINDLHFKGNTIKTYLDSRYKRELVNAFEFTLADGSIILCKNGSGNSWNFQDEIMHYPAVCLFSFSGKNGLWTHSVYSHATSDFDCAKFCEQYGGGGHKHAAGFQVKEPVFTPKFN